MVGADAPASSPVVRRSSLREQIANALREEMMAGRLPAGRSFTVKEVAEQYGVSATPVREALVDLTAQGLLWIEHHRGFTVPALGWGDFVEILETRVLVTDGIFRHLHRRLREADRNRLPSVRRRAEAAQRAAEAGELHVVVGCDRRFWAEFGGLVGSPRVVDYLDWLRVQTWMFAAPYLRGRDDLADRLWTGHLELVDLVEERDLAGVYRALDGYHRESAGLMAELCGESAEGVGASMAGYPGGGPARVPGQRDPRPELPGER
jgi:DNA-binding GntR family transcriptional regulator